jgi:periplasmic divalent cation tolerance protein
MIFLYITCRDVDEAKKIGRALVEKHLAACANIAPIQSVYSDNGKVKEVNEASLLVKTVEQKVQQAEDVVRALHSYKLPCIASLSLYRLNREYKEWVVSCVA